MDYRPTAIKGNLENDASSNRLMLNPPMRRVHRPLGTVAHHYNDSPDTVELLHVLDD